MSEQRPHILLGEAIHVAMENAVTNPVVNAPQIDTSGKTSFTDITNLNNTWVIVKRHNGNTFFKRRSYVTCLKNHPDRECLFYDKTKADAEVTLLNSQRKKCKYIVENASKYFVNNFTFTGNSYWATINAVIKNEAIPIKEISEKKNNLVSFEKVKVQANDFYTRTVTDKEKHLKEAVRIMPIKLKELEVQLQKAITDAQKNYDDAVNQKDQFNTTDFSFVEKFETQGDRLVKVLYSNKPKEQTLTTQDSRGF